MIHDETIKIRVGGREFTTRRETLKAFPDTVLARAVQWDPVDLGDWDRDPVLFQSILDYYRTLRMVFPPDVPYSKIKDELLFWGFVLDSPPRPTWPVVPARHSHRHDPTHPVVTCPWGLTLRMSALGCPHVLLCHLWSSIRRSPLVWSAAQAGFRNICIFWKTRCMGLDPNLVTSHLDFLRKLASLDMCEIHYVSKVGSLSLEQESRTHDVHTVGFFASAVVNQHVHEWSVKGTCRSEVHEMSCYVSHGEQSTTFDHQGFRFHFHVNEDRAWWNIVPLMDGEECQDPDICPLALQNTSGCIIDVYLRLGTLVVHAFSFPTSEFRSRRLRGDIFLTQYYVPLAQDPGWYLCTERCRLPCAMATHEHVQELCASTEDVDVTFLFEAKVDSALITYPIKEIIYPRRKRDLPDEVYYDKFLLQW